jgi:hypothetical protein
MVELSRFCDRAAAALQVLNTVVNATTGTHHCLSAVTTAISYGTRTGCQAFDADDHTVTSSAVTVTRVR